ncbi:Branched-chain amino acid transport protein (AzlD) [Streptomyces sp. DvalAA-14]|uniref:AzlD domain-containing protein n=1 Tax=unclassified Streptomyces TaxID=2593676 RepID=UPI00081AF87C|nr:MULTISPECIES: AzlD domain-containing protein [unclassified Streptomyces]MYS19771.1 AzlD domain-containing protein [Streptomyces sp. SID4948]SCD52819.1 Branched-chain amino acid transport protein (AzlD) [Streptomyces sp. DvalAA-14]
MTSASGLVAATVLLGAGTFAFRLAGPVLRARVALSPRVERLTNVAVVVLLAALVATSALTEAHGFAGVARAAGVVVGGVCAWRRAPFVVVVIAAAVTAAALRLLGVN